MTPGALRNATDFGIDSQNYDLDIQKLRDVGGKLHDLPLDTLFVLPMFLSDALGYFSGKRMLQGWASRAWSAGPRYGVYPVIERPPVGEKIKMSLSQGSMCSFSLSCSQVGLRTMHGSSLPTLSPS